jgi:hypothetical protein
MTALNCFLAANASNSVVHRGESMAITMVCECGKRLSVKDEHAGKRGKCPACQRVLRIPDEPCYRATLAATRVAPTESQTAAIEHPVAVSKRGSERAWLTPVVLFGSSAAALIAISCFVYVVSTKPRTDGVNRAQDHGNTPASRETLSSISAQVPPAIEPLTEPALPRTPKTPRQSFAHRLAAIEAGRSLPADDPAVASMDLLLKGADRLYTEDEGTIAAMAGTMHKKLVEATQMSSILEFLDGSTRWHVPGYFGMGVPRKFEEYFRLYYIFRLGENRLGHKDAIDMIRATCSGLNPGDC